MRNRIVTMICFLTGLALCSYPLISSLMERRIQERTVATYRKEMEQSADAEHILKNAQEYNRMLNQTQGAVVGDIDQNLLSESSYYSQLSVGEKGVMGALEIPEINVNLPIRHGTSEEVISGGVGHLQGSSLPAGGENTRSILTSHRGLPSSKLFTRLDELKKGDLFFVNVCDEIMAYRVCEILVIAPDEMERLAIIPGKDLVSLVTCTPYGLNTHRLVVTGERVPYQKKVYDSISPNMFSARELIFSILPLMFSGAMLAMHIKNRKKRCKCRNGQVKNNSQFDFYAHSGDLRKRN